MSALLPVEVVVIIGTHGGIRSNPHDGTHVPRTDEFQYLFPVLWSDDVEVCGITMPFGGNVNYADDTRETQAVHAAELYLKTTPGTFFDNNNRKLRHLADALLDSDEYLPVVCVNGSQDQFSEPKIHLGATLESDFDNEVSNTMEGVTGFDAVKGCTDDGVLDKRQIIANYVPLMYSGKGKIETTATGLTKVPLCSKVFTLNSEEYSKGTGTYAFHDLEDPKPYAEWKVTLLIKYANGRVDRKVVRVDQFVQELLHVPPPPGIFGSEGAAQPHLRHDEHSKAFYTETLISYLISIGATKITLLDVTCCVYRNSGPYRPAGYPFGDVCEHGITPATRNMLHDIVTPWIMLSRFGIRTSYREDSHFYPERGEKYYTDRFRNATFGAVRYLINTYYDYLQLIYDCKEAVLRQVEIDATTQGHTLKVALKTKTPNTKSQYIQAFFNLYKQRSTAIPGKPITQPRSQDRSLHDPLPGSRHASPPRQAARADEDRLRKPSRSPPPRGRRGGKPHKTRRVKRNKSRNFRNKSKSRSRRTRRRVIKRKNNKK